MMSVLVQRKREAYRNQLRDFLLEAPGGSFYDEERFDLQQYRVRCSKLLLPHESASVSLAGIPSVKEDSWFWKERQLLMYLMNPLNITRLHDECERYIKACEQYDLNNLELGMRCTLVADVVDRPKALMFHRGETIKIKGFDAAALPVLVGQVHTPHALWVGVGCVQTR